jgi:ABC-2 type transport system permease protein
MTALATSVGEISPVAVAPGVTFGRVVRSERIKLTSLPSTAWAAAGGIAASAAFAGLIVLGIVLAPAAGADAAQVATDTFGTRPGIGGVGFVVIIAQLFAAMLGVLLVTSERSSGLLATTVAAVPRRTPILAAKLLVSAVASFAVGLVIAVVSWILVEVALAVVGLPAWQVDAATVQVLIGSALYLALISVFATAVGSLFRNSAAGLGVVLGAMILVPALLPLIPVVGDTVARFLPTAAGMLLYQPFDQVGWGSIVAGLGILLAWVAVASAGAAVLWKKRDI